MSLDEVAKASALGYIPFAGTITAHAFAVQRANIKGTTSEQVHQSFTNFGKFVLKGFPEQAAKLLSQYPSGFVVGRGTAQAAGAALGALLQHMYFKSLGMDLAPIPEGTPQQDLQTMVKKMLLSGGLFTLPALVASPLGSRAMDFIGIKPGVPRTAALTVGLIGAAISADVLATFVRPAEPSTVVELPADPQRVPDWADGI